MRRLRQDASRLYGDGPGGPGNVLVRVAVRPYRSFVRRIDRQLAELIERWARAAPPSFERPESFAAGPKPK